MHGHRRGVSTLLALVGQTDLPIKAVYIDDFQHGSRSEVEPWKLAG
ncbi:MAG TPA: hypothetical protein PKC18_12975 [Lacipirellulaceae bacterium]|nr:hypothetical protein [Lacipirellulaceae bacterium]HMP06431.1 hypothetical protein [Lacipirellulaceae bacterium]